MKINLIKKHNLLMPYSTDDVNKIDGFEEYAVYECDIKNIDIRSLKQNNALHRYFSLVSIELNQRGHKIDPQNLNIDWSMTRVKELIWKEFQKIVLQKDSTRLLTKKELTEIYDYVNQYLGQTFEFNVEFPNREQLEGV